MSNTFPDWQEIQQWTGQPLAAKAAFALGAGTEDTGPLPVGSWASIILIVKATAQPVTVTVTTTVTGITPTLATVQTFTVTAGTKIAQTLIMLGDTVEVVIVGGGAGCILDYAVVPSNVTTNAQVVTDPSIQVQHNGALVGTEKAVDFEDLANGLLFTVTDDGPNTRVKITPVIGNPFWAPGNVFINKGGAGEMSIQSNKAVYFSNTGADYIYLPVAGLLATASRLGVGGVDVHRSVRQAQSHIEGGFVSVPPGGPGVSFSFALVFAGAPTMVCASNNNTVPVAVFSTSTTGGSLYHASGATVNAYWLAEGQG